MSYWREGDPVHNVEVENGSPRRFTWQGQTHLVKQIANSWRIDDSWWQRRLWRDYYKLITSTGLLLILSHDLLDGEWRLVRVYD